MDVSIDYYELLGVERTATCSEVNAAYRIKAKELHPDSSFDPQESEGVSEVFTRLAHAKKILCNPCSRRQYDAEYEKKLNHKDEGQPTNPDVGQKDLDKEDEKSSSESGSQNDVIVELMNKFYEITNNVGKGIIPQQSYDRAFHLFVGANTALHTAIINDNLGEVEELIQVCGADSNVDNSFDYSPLHYASLFGYSDLIILLLENGALITQNKYGETPLHLALRNGHVKAAHVLVEKEGLEAFHLNDDTENTPFDLINEVCSADEILKRVVFEQRDLSKEKEDCLNLLSLVIVKYTEEKDEQEDQSDLVNVLVDSGGAIQYQLDV
jgi:hypothetical protein